MPEEVPKQVARLKALDRDKDGRITREEAIEVLGRFRQQRDDRKAAADFAEAQARDEARHRELLAALEKPAAAPVINVAPPAVNVTVQKSGEKTQTVERDASGNILRITTREG